MSYVRSVGTKEAERSIRQYLRKLEAEEWGRREVIVAEVLEEWLPRPLHFLMDHRRLLKLWIKLPHKRVVIIRHWPDGRMEALIVKRGES
jgi:hypothetical protein